MSPLVGIFPIASCFPIKRLSADVDARDLASADRSTQRGVKGTQRAGDFQIPALADHQTVSVEAVAYLPPNWLAKPNRGKMQGDENLRNC